MMELGIPRRFRPSGATDAVRNNRHSSSEGLMSEFELECRLTNDRQEADQCSWMRAPEPGTTLRP